MWVEKWVEWEVAPLRPARRCPTSPESEGEHNDGSVGNERTGFLGNPSPRVERRTLVNWTAPVSVGSQGLAVQRFQPNVEEYRRATNGERRERVVVGERNG